MDSNDKKIDSSIYKAKVLRLLAIEARKLYYSKNLKDRLVLNGLMLAMKIVRSIEC